MLSKKKQKKTDLYYKPNHIDQYSDINKNVPWHYKIYWINSLDHLSKNTFSSSKKFRFQIYKIKMSMFWNGCPSFTPNSIIKWLKTSPTKVEKEKNDSRVPSVIPCEFYVIHFWKPQCPKNKKNKLSIFIRTGFYFTDQNRTDPKYRKKLTTQDWQLLLLPNFVPTLCISFKSL